MAVTLVAVVSHFWDTPRSVWRMVASRLATRHDDAASALRMRVTDRDAVPGGEPGLTEKVAAPLDTVLTLELDGAAFALAVAADDLLLAAFGRTVARTMGDGVVAVDIVRDGRSVPSLVDLFCVGERHLDATGMVVLAHQMLSDLSLERPGDHLGDGGARADVLLNADVLFNYVGTTPAHTATPPLVGHALELRAYRDGGVMQVDWWFDSSRFDHATVQEFAEQFPFALIELTSEATPQA